MTRLVWPTVATLIIIAIGAPCLTFYLLIKDYWAEVALLRQKLLLCQFSTQDQATLSSVITTVSWEHLPFQDDPPQPLPNPLPLTSSGLRFPSSAETNFAFDVLQKEEAEGLPKNYAPDEESTLLQRLQVPNEKPYMFRLFNSKKFPEEELMGDTPDPRSESNKMISDVAKTKKEENMLEEEVCLPEEYIEKIEKRVLDLSAKFESCRKCLESQLQKEIRCGGGATWKEYRRNEKTLRKEIREHKRKRRRKEKKENSKQNVKNEEGTTLLNRKNTSEPNFEEPSISETEFDSMREWHSDASPVLNTHNIRENYRVSTDFRRGFNQKISRMDEALMQFTETQSAFCKELRDNLGGRLEKRGQELEALSEQIAALVRTTTIQVAMLEKLASDQVYTGQTSIEKNLENLQTLRDSQTRAIQDYHKKTFIPSMITITSLLGEQASSVTNMGVDLITKVEMLQDVYLNFATKQGDTLVKVSEFVDMFVTKHSNLIMRSRDHAKHLHINTENFIRELQTRMNNVVKELVLVRLQSQSFISVNENTFHEISSSLNKTSDVVESMSQALQEKVNAAKEEETDFRKVFRKETDIINERIESGISRVLMNNHGAVTQIGEIDLETSLYSERAEATWNELYSNQETELRQEADMLANNLRSHNHHTQNILTGLQGTAGTHEQVLEQHRMDFQNFIRSRQDALDTQCSSINDWALLMSSELRRRDEDLHRFLSEELRFSPVPAKETHNYDDYLVSRLPDGTLLYDSSPSDDSTHYQGWPYRNGTYHLEGKTSKSWMKPGNSPSHTPSNASLPIFTNPSRLQGILSTNVEEISIVNAIQPDNISIIAKLEINDSTPDKLERNKMTFPNTQLLNVKSNDSLSSDVAFVVDETNDNATITMSDQSSLHQSNTSKAGCKDNSTTVLANFGNTTEDEGFVKLKDIVMEAKKSILRFQKEFDVGDDFREIKKSVWKNFRDKGINHSTITTAKTGREFFNFSEKFEDKNINLNSSNKSANKVGDNKQHDAPKSVNNYRRNKRRKKTKYTERGQQLTNP